MYFMYILFSRTLDKYYPGYTADKLQERLRKHNSDHKGFTVGKGDWVLEYFEEYKTKELAYAREREIKSWKSRKKIVALICKGNSASLKHPDL